MIGGFAIGAAGMAAHQLQSDLIGFNLANVNTAGFRRREAVFAEVMAGTYAGVGVQAVTVDHRPGAVSLTGRDLDLAISGPGFFRLLGPDGERFTRVGHFTLAADGTLRGPGDLVLAGADGPIRLPANTSVVVAADGTVQSVTADDVRSVGQLALGVPQAPEALAPVGGGLWQTVGTVDLVAAGGAAGVISGGAVEAANVDLTAEMAALMRSVRFYQFSARAVQAANDLSSAAVAMVRP